MVGLYGGSPFEYASLEEQGTEAVPASTGEVLSAAFGQGLAANPTPRLLRAQRRYDATYGQDFGTDEFGTPITGEPEPLLDPDTANAEYGIKGALNFDKPIPQSVAKDLYEHKRAQLQREDTISRREGGLLTGGAARFSASIAASLLDPINIASGFVPLVGPTRYGALVGQAAGFAGRVGVRAGIGVAEGATGAAILQPLEFGLARGELEDYTMADALRNIAFGAVLGGGLHVGLGAVVDGVTGKYRNPITQQIEDAGPEAREIVLQGALAQTIEGRPVDVAPVIGDRLIVAARDPDGTLHIGRPGEIHADLVPNSANAEMGFVDFGRNFLTREEAFDRLKPGQQQRLKVQGELDAADYELNARDVPDIDGLVAGARREAPEEIQARIDADEIMARPSEELQFLQKQVADLEQQIASPKPETPRADDSQPTAARAANAEETAAQAAADIGEARARAAERAAVCIQRGG